MHDRFNFYEIMGILVPGYALLGGGLIATGKLSPADIPSVTLGGVSAITVGAVVIGFIAHGISAYVGNAYHRITKGMPSSWPATRKTVPYLDNKSLTQLQDLSGAGKDTKAWRTFFDKSLAILRRNGLASGSDRFLANYAFNRSMLTVALLGLAWQIQKLADIQWRIFILLLIAAIHFGISMNRHGQHFARDIYAGRLALEEANQDRRPGDP